MSSVKSGVEIEDFVSGNDRSLRWKLDKKFHWSLDLEGRTTKQVLFGDDKGGNVKLET